MCLLNQPKLEIYQQVAYYITKLFIMMSIDSKLKKLVQRELIVFDFDETLVDCNSDSWVHQLAPGKRIPEQLEYRQGQDYFKHVQSVLAYLYSQKVTEQDYYDCLKTMPSVAGIVDSLIVTLAKQPDKYDMIILSDANSVFIDSYLRANSLDTAFSTVLTNPARFSDDGQLLIDEYQVQDYCSLSARNLCKGDALKNFIGKRMLDHNTVYTCINYVGDGENDLCPSTKLSARDRVFPREGYSLDRLCKKLKFNNGIQHHNMENGKLPEVKATVVPWNTGDDILNVIIGGTQV